MDPSTFEGLATPLYRSIEFRYVELLKLVVYCAYFFVMFEISNHGRVTQSEENEVTLMELQTKIEILSLDLAQYLSIVCCFQKHGSKNKVCPILTNIEVTTKI